MVCEIQYFGIDIALLYFITLDNLYTIRIAAVFIDNIDFCGINWPVEWGITS